jgi:hypothetical protein
MKRGKYLLVLVISAMGCKKPYNPPAITASANYLVVEGVINPGSDSTIIKLSRTVKLLSKPTTNPVPGALLTVESDQNMVYSLTEMGNGNYASPGLNLDENRNYRLRIKTNDHQQYLSDFVPVKITPSIDSVGFNVNTVNNSVQIYANAHDATNNTRYYRWDYDETWKFQAKYISYFVLDGSTFVQRQPNQNITLCFTGDVSNDIVLGTSAKLQQDKIHQSPIVQIPSTSEKIELTYSILLRQYALTSDAYNFWEKLRKNTEKLGSIFDAQPSAIEGNIHCISNSSQPVIGYISVSTIPSKRVFINKNQLPDSWLATYPYTCPLDSVNIGSPLYYLTIYSNPDEYLPTSPIGPNFLPVGFYYTSRECADCTIRGTTKQPLFWK